MEQGYIAGFLILGEPGRCVPQEEGGGVPLMNLCVNLLGDASRCLCGSCIHWVNHVGFQHCLVAARKWVCLRGGEIRTVCAICRHQIGQATKDGHDEGMRALSQSLATRCSHESSAS